LSALFITIAQRVPIVANQKKSSAKTESRDETAGSRVKFEIYGEEMLEKEVKLSGNSGRVYLPPNWVGHLVKIVRID
jgi:putative transposon-encoded protein